MPTVLRAEGFQFFFYSNAGDPREPPRVHVRQGGADAKFWLGPPVEMARSAAFDARTLRRISDIVRASIATFEEAWHGDLG